MALLQKIFQSNFEVESDILRTKDEEKIMGLIKYKKAAYQVDNTHLAMSRWERMMKISDGMFFVTAQRVIEDVLRFQIDKMNRSIRAGYLDDPENLFCEELKIGALSNYVPGKLKEPHFNISKEEFPILKRFY